MGITNAGQRSSSLKRRLGKERESVEPRDTALWGEWVGRKLSVGIRARWLSAPLVRAGAGRGDIPCLCRHNSWKTPKDN